MPIMVHSRPLGAQERTQAFTSRASTRGTTLGVFQVGPQPVVGRIRYSEMAVKSKNGRDSRETDRQDCAKVLPNGGGARAPRFGFFQMGPGYVAVYGILKWLSKVKMDETHVKHTARNARFVAELASARATRLETFPGRAGTISGRL